MENEHIVESYITPPETVKQYFTFGLGHGLAKFYVEIEGETKGACRGEMVELFGSHWAFQYDSVKALNGNHNAVPYVRLPLTRTPSGHLRLEPEACHGS